jgi:Zn-dependent protease
MGLLVLLAKLGPKLLPLVLKLKEALFNLAKSAIGIKGAGAATSVGIYGYLYTWEMGIAIVLFIGIHEYGHLWAMHRCGIKTRGMYFIPGFGAVAVADDRFGSARNESFVAIMGPVFGFAFFILPCLAYWHMAGSKMFSAFAAVGTFVNLINLLTIMPLDGGRMLKSIVYSENHGRSFVLAFIISIGTAVAAGFAGFFLFTYMAIIGFMEMFCEFGINKRMQHFTVSLWRVALGFGWFLTGKYLLLDNWVFSEDWLPVIFTTLAFCFITFMAWYDIWKDNNGLVRTLVMYPVKIVREFGIGIVELLSLRSSHIQPIDSYEVMGLKAKSFYTLLFIGTIIIHGGVLLYLSITPEGALMGEMLK